MTIGERIDGFSWLVAAALLAPVVSSAAMTQQTCQVIAHRGASGHLPEHTLAAYQLAIDMGADFIEPDVVLTRDGVPIVRHENLLDLTTDVAEHPEFADRRRTRSVDGKELTGWFSEDFTAAEIAKLRATERWPELRPQNAARNGEFAIPTLAEAVEFWVRARREAGRPIGIYPELKHPEHFAQFGLDSAELITAVLVRLLPQLATGAVETRSIDDDVRPQDILLQSFSPDALRRAAARINTPRILLLGYARTPAAIADETSAAALADIAAYADGIGVPKYGYVLPETATTGPVTSALVERAHAAGLLVHVYTFRAENRFLPAALQSSADPAAHGDLAAEIERFVAAGIDGLFADYPDIAVEVCRAR